MEISLRTVLILPSIIIGSVIAYNVLHVSTTEDVDASSLKPGKYFAFKNKIKDDEYQTTIYVKQVGESGEPDGVVTLNGTVKGVVSDAAVGMLKFTANDIDCSGTNLTLVYSGHSAVIGMDPNGGFSQKCQMKKFLRDGDKLVRIYN